MDSPNPKENTAINIRQREFIETDGGQIKHDIWLLEQERLEINKRQIYNRRLSEAIIIMYQKGIFDLSSEEFEILASGIVTKEIRESVKETFFPAPPLSPDEK